MATTNAATSTWIERKAEGKCAYPNCDHDPGDYSLCEPHRTDAAARVARHKRRRQNVTTTTTTNGDAR